MKSSKQTLSIDRLIDIVQRGGTVKTGVDVYNKEAILLLEKNVLIKTTKPLLIIKQNGISEVPIDPNVQGGLWDQDGKNILSGMAKEKPSIPSGLKEKVDTITQVKKEAAKKYRKAKENIKKVIDDIKKTGGEFDRTIVEETVTDLFDFITRNDSAFFYLTRDIFSYDDYLYHHSINVCTIGTAILKKATELPGNRMDRYSQKDLFDISTGFFLHDVGKVLIPDNILNKPGKLTPEEFEVVKGHSFTEGPKVLKKNRIRNPLIQDIVQGHHSALFPGEDRCYPPLEDNEVLPPHVKIGKLADIYDAMTSKRCYKDAFNPVSVVTTIVRGYAGKEDALQHLLHAFVKSVGIYPPGSVVHLMNKRLAYILDSEGPVVIPFTNEIGETVPDKADPVDLADESQIDAGWKVNDEKPLASPTEAYKILPDYLRQPLAA